MKVYVITKGSYSDYHICTVTDSKEKAEFLCKKFSDYEPAYIEEFDTEDVNIIDIGESTKCFCCHYEKNGISVAESEFDYADYRVLKSRKESLRTYVNAENEEEALKKASDKFTKYRAETMKL